MERYAKNGKSERKVWKREGRKRIVEKINTNWIELVVQWIA